MKKLQLFLTALLVPVDFLTLLASALVAYALRYSSWLTKLREVTFDLNFEDYLAIVIPICLLWLPIFALHGLYTTRPPRIATEIKRIILAIFTGIALILLIAFFSRELFDSRFIFLATWILATIFMITVRVSVRLLRRFLQKAGLGLQKTVVVGNKKDYEDLVQYLNSFPRLGYKIVEKLDYHSIEKTKKALLELKNNGAVDTIIVTDRGMKSQELETLKTFSDNEHLHFLYVASIFPTGAVKPTLHTFAGIPVVEIPKTPLEGWGVIYKRIFDIIGSLVLIIITLPIQIPVAIYLLLERQGGILFTSKRVGRQGKLFTFLKFRSMIKDAHKHRFDPKFIEKYGNQRSDSPLFKLQNDPRITKFGRFIRKTSIDEFPQFYSVLFGKMSLVGPRPHLPEEVDLYEPHQRRVLAIKPGITGLAQISGRANLKFEDEVQLDIYYIEHWTPWLDLIILIKTPLTVIFSKGAY